MKRYFEEINIVPVKSTATKTMNLIPNLPYGTSKREVIPMFKNLLKTWKSLAETLINEDARASEDQTIALHTRWFLEKDYDFVHLEIRNTGMDRNYIKFSLRKLGAENSQVSFKGYFPASETLFFTDKDLESAGIKLVEL